MPIKLSETLDNGVSVEMLRNNEGSSETRYLEYAEGDRWYRLAVAVPNFVDWLTRFEGHVQLLIAESLAASVPQVGDSIERENDFSTESKHRSIRITRLKSNTPMGTDLVRLLITRS